MKVVVCKGNYDRLEIALSPIRSQWNNGHLTSLEQRLLKLVRGIWYTLYLSEYRLDILGMLCIHAGSGSANKRG